MRTLLAVLLILLILLFIAALSALGALVFMLLWNVVVPAAFNGPELSFGTAWCFTALLTIIGRALRNK